MSRILVTGASGFIGRRVVPLLGEAGHEVHATTSGETDTKAPPATWHRVDLLEPGATEAVLAEVRPEALLHLAWYTEHGRFWGAPENLAWVEASLRLWRAFADAGGRRFVGVGSCAEYAWSEPVLSERSTPLEPTTLYGASKDALRRTLEMAARTAGNSLAWARVFFVYGPEDHPDRLVTSVVSGLIAGEPVPVTDGSQVRDFLHVSDVAAALGALLDGEVEGPVNLGSGEGVAVRHLVGLLGRAAGRPELIELGALPRPEGDPDAIVADVSRLRDEVGWTPSIELERGLDDVIARARSAVR